MSAYKELKLTIKLFAGHAFHGLLIQMQNINLKNSSMCRRQNLEIGFGFKSDTAVFTISFCFLSSPVLLLFLPHFFSCAWPLVGVILEGTVFEKAFRILKLDEWKNSWVVKEDFHGNFWVNVTFFLPFFSGLLLVGFERSLHPAQMSLAVKTDDVYGW